MAALLGAELAATRKVTDKGWAPRARQVGITGRSIAPRLYLAVGLSGKFNHMVGVRAAGTIVAINDDPGALVFSQCDIGHRRGLARGRPRTGRGAPAAWSEPPPLSPARSVASGPATPPRGHPEWVTHLVQMRRSR